MRGNSQEPDERPRPIFSRSSDGKLRAGGLRITPASPAPAPEPSRPAGARQQVQTSQHLRPAPARPPQQPVKHQAPVPAQQHDIGDLWSEQERIRLQEAWEEEQRKAARRQRIKDRLMGGKPKGITDTAKADGVAVTARRAATEPKEVTLNFNIPSIPKVSMPHIPFPRLSKKKLIAIGSVFAVVGVGLGGYIVYRHYDREAVAGTTSKTSVTRNENGVQIEQLDPSLAKGTPSYDTVLPAGKTIQDFGGWVRVSPQDKEAVYAYADKIGDVLVNVSEQPLPANFKDNTTTAMENLAKQFNANSKVAAEGVTLYIGTSAKGPQSVLFTKDDLLVLIKSASKIDDDRWITYVNSLR